MILYHGSNVIIDNIDLSKSKVGKDFGCGFYLTPNQKTAYRQAQRKTELYQSGEPIVNQYSFELEFAKNLNLYIKSFDGYSSEWADFVLLNRQNKKHTLIHHYDIVVGPIADDTVGYQIRRFMTGIISKEEFLENLKYMKGVEMQYFFGTESAIKLLKKI